MALRSGYQIEVATLDYQVLPAMLILACYAREYEDVELVDDYEGLVKAVDEGMGEFGLFAHPDLFLASCIRLLHKREMAPSYEGFLDVKMDKMFQQLTNVV